MVGWHDQLNGYEFEQTPGDSEGQGSLMSSSPWGHKESDKTWRLNNNNNKALVNFPLCMVESCFSQCSARSEHSCVAFLSCQ